MHLVVYYRYIRFYPDGTVTVNTTAEEPAQVVGKMHRNNFMRGNYKYAISCFLLLMNLTAGRIYIEHCLI